MLLSFAAGVATVVASLVILAKIQSRRLRKSVSGKHVWVVGASRGIGRATAQALARHGATVSISSRDTEALRQVHNSLGTGCGLMVPMDVTSDTVTLREVIDQIQQYRIIDVVILNAGINQSNKPFSQLKAHDIDHLIDTNFRSVARLAYLLLPCLRVSNGVFCVISSLSAYRGLPGASVYGATKSAVTTFCQSLAVELYDEGVDVVCVHPGFVDTSAIRSLDHPKPFLVSERSAAQRVLEAVEARQLHVGFPWFMEHVVMTLGTHVPTFLYNFILSRVT